MNELVITHNVPTKARKPRKAKTTATASKWTDLTISALRQACASRGVKFTTKHTKPELIAMAQTGIYIRPAAYDRAKAKSQAKA